MSKKETSFGNTQLGQSLGIAAVILALCLGIGGCLMLGRDVNPSITTITKEVPAE